MLKVHQRYRQTDGRTDGQTDGWTKLVGAYARSPSYSWAPARTLGRSIDSAAGAARTQQKTSALGKPDADLFIARTDASQPTNRTDSSQSDSAQL